MKINILYCLAMTMSLLNQSSAFAQTEYTAKAKPKQSYSSAMAAPVVNFNGIINSDRILLNWTLDKNQLVDQIEVERSSDEKKFAMAGLVFGTDEEDKVRYMFYEKNKKIKFFYRLKIINKDFSIAYSRVIAPEPAIAKQ